MFIAGDSAYAVSPFLLTPYDIEEMKVDVDHAKDSFNFHLSSCRVYIECAFGELVMRWGILWRTLSFGLKKNADIIQVCMLLHNFIIDSRECEEDSSYFRDFNIRMDSLQQQLTEQTGEMPRPVVTNNNEPRTRGGPSLDDIEMRRVGGLVRHRLTVKLASNDMRRPL